MIVKIFDPVKGFPGAGYNLRKIDQGKAELMKMTNFGALGDFGKLRVQDVQDYLVNLAALNKRIVYPQMHATISAEGRSSTPEELTKLAEGWLQLMGYGNQPYLIVFHKDTANNHVHLLTSRIDKNGKKISSAFENNRAIACLNKAVGLDEDLAARKDVAQALAYRFSTKAQFAMLLELKGYVVKDTALIKFGRKLLELPALEFTEADQKRAGQLKAIFEKYRQRYSTDLIDANGVSKFKCELSDFLKLKLGVELVIHASENKPPYGYTVIDHAQKNVFKGGDILPLKTLLESALPYESSFTYRSGFEVREPAAPYLPPVVVSIADDVDDQQIHGMRRRRQKKARTNTR